MTVLERKTGSGVGKKGVGLGSYIVVGLVAVAIGIGAATGFSRIGSSDELSPSRISQVRASEFAAVAENQWIAEVNSTRNADLLARYEGAFFAGLAEVQSQKASDLAQHQASLHQAKVAEIQAQRAQDLAAHYGGMFGLTPSEIEQQRGQDMATFKRGWEGETGR